MSPRKAVKSTAPSQARKSLAMAAALKVPDTGKQVFVAAFLEQMRKSGLHKAVSDAATRIAPSTLRAEIVAHAPATGLALLHGTGVRDEEVFATPSVLHAEPGALAYYRLLLGISQKQFYTKTTGLNVFKAMEERQQITTRAEAGLIDLCIALNEAMTRLVHTLPSGTLRIDVDQLPLLTLGAQADGSWRTQIGTKATREVFNALKAIVRAAGHPFTETVSSITTTNNSGREVTLMLAPDPDVVIRENFGTSVIYKAAIEIKGGTDYSNIHNRAGEAEKSHQKARQDGAGDCWTVIHLKKANMTKLKQESPTTREWIDLADVHAGSGPAWERLAQLTKAAMGI